MTDEVVISGISGRFPESDNIAEFSQNLFNKVDLVIEDGRRWEPGLYGLPRRMGQLKDISKFDSQFFGVHPKQAHMLDPQIRILLELTYEAIIDAGYDPEELRGRNIGVFVGNCSSESDEFFCHDPKKINGYNMTGCSRAMFANRISYTFDFKGPSFVVDTACSSGALALYEAVHAIQNNECESAIVGAANLCLRPATSLGFFRLNALSKDGVCKSFDADADGYGRSEAVVSLFLQKYEVARRNYASIVHIKTNNDGFKEQGPTYPSAEMQKQLMREVYGECKLNPLEVCYVEAHGTGTSAGDPVEMSAISEIFCFGRKEPLWVGSVKSNMGHSAPASGLCSIAKIIISMEQSLIPPNLHYQKPNTNIKSLVDGQIKVVTIPTQLDSNYVAMNNFGFGGVNVHAVLKSNTSERKPKYIEDIPIPQLALYSGRTEEGVQYMFDYLQNETPPREFFALLHKSAYSSASGKPYRGYKLLLKDQEISGIKKIIEGYRPVWYVFYGIGTQWPCMAQQLMNLEVFANSIRRSADVLKRYDLDLIDLLTSRGNNDSNQKNVISSFVSIAAVEVALVDVLTEIGITPDGIIGHSVGELGCAYADGCISAEQTVLAAYWRGKALKDSNLETGAMAAIGVNWSQANKCCPKDIFPACNNAEDSVTVSGPKDSVKLFVETLKSKNVFAREVDSCGYAFHSQYVNPAAEKLQTALEKIIPNPKTRSSRWITSAYPVEEWDDPSSKVAGAAYFVKNFVSPVLFYEALQHVPKNAIVVEIAPHHLLQTILKRVIGPGAEYIGLMKRNVDNTVHLMSNLGRLYTAGLNPDIEKLYPQVRFPVPRGTPMLSPLMKWDHSESWCVAKWDKNMNQSQMITEVNVGSDESPDKYLLDHYIDGRCLYPAAGYLVMAWKALAEIKGKDVKLLPVTLEEVKIHRTIALYKTASTKFHVDILKVGGEFEISEGGMVVCNGRIYSHEGVETDASELLKSNNLKQLPLNQQDIYKELKQRGYEYGPTFQVITGADIEGTKGLLKWSEEWVIFLDAMIQFTILGSPRRDLCLPSRIQSIKIDPVFHKSVIHSAQKEYKGVPIFHFKNARRIISGGIELKNLKTNFSPRNKSEQTPLLEKHCFIPYNESNFLSKSEKEKLEKYINVCSSVAKRIMELSGKNKDQISKIMKRFEEADSSIVTNYLNSFKHNQVLLKFLSDVINNATSKDFAQQIKTYINDYLIKRDNDLLYQTLFEENPLRTVIKVVLENVPSRKFKVAEISETTLLLSIKIEKLLQTRGISDVKHVIVHSESNTLNRENLPSGNWELLSWNQKSDLPFQDIDLCLLKFLNYPGEELRRILKYALDTLNSNGFILLLQRTRLVPAEMFLSATGGTVLHIHTECDLERTFKDLSLQVICKKSDASASVMYLLRKSADSCYEDITIPILENKYEKCLEEVSDHMKIPPPNTNPKRIWLVSEASNKTGIIGLFNCLRHAPGGSNIRCIFISNETQKVPKFSLKNEFFQDILQKNLSMNVFQNGTWGSYRYLTISKNLGKVKTKHACLKVLTPGDLSSLVWIDSSLKYFKESARSVLCQVYYAPLNFRDVMLANGKLTADSLPGYLTYQDSILGIEFSGRLENGQRVMGLVPYKGLATIIAADPKFLWKVPDDWSLEEASTVPVAYSTAYYALIMRGNLRKGERVLIHSGSGGIGQAAIAIALSLGCEVFTTVGSTEEKDFLKKRFSVLQDRNFSNSMDASFEQYILNISNGEGVDVILNSLAEGKFKATLNCLGQNGRFLEIGKYDLTNNILLETSIFSKNISFLSIQLDVLFEDTNYSFRSKNEIVQLVKEGIINGTVKPLNALVFDHDDAEEAFRFMTSSKHFGKVVLKIRDEETQNRISPTPMEIKVVSLTTCNPEKSYVIIEGLSNFGLELCQWLVGRGARHLVLTSRSGIKTGYEKLCFNRWKKHNINVIVSKLDITKKDELRELLKYSSPTNPVAAIFNLALFPTDGLSKIQITEDFRNVCESAITLTLRLDAGSRRLCPDLDWFVCFTSLIFGEGNARKKIYSYANSVMERICEERTKEGLPGLAIQWGPISVLEDKVESNVGSIGAIPQTISSCLTVLDYSLHENLPVVTSFVPNQVSETVTKKNSSHNIVATVSNIFGIKDMSTINPESSLGELGMDSLLGLEVKQLLEKNFNQVLLIHELRKLKLKDLTNLEVCPEKKTSTHLSQTKSTSYFTFESSTKLVKKVLGNFCSLSNKQFVPVETIIKLNSMSNGIPLLIVHPIEGTTVTLNSLAPLISFPVYGIQCTPEAPSDSIEELAAWYWKHIKLLNISNTICLAGYSFGAAVAFEMCLQAKSDPQQRVKVLKLILLDGSPAFVSAYARRHNSLLRSHSIRDEKVQILYSFVLQFLDVDIKEFKKNLMDLPSFVDRVKKSLETISATYSHLKTEELSKAFDLYYKKLQMALKYKPEQKLDTEVLLIKALDSIEITNELSESHDLDQICEGKLAVYKIKGTHNSFIQGNGAKEVSNLINDIFMVEDWSL